MANGPDRIILVRHGESLRNAIPHGSFFHTAADRDRLGELGNHQVPLTELGQAQAAATGVALRERFGKPDAVIHSGYQRTMETAAGLLNALTDEERASVPVREHLFLRERDSGYTYDMTTEEAERHFPFIARHWRVAGRFFATPVGGESFAKVAERAYHLLRELREDYDGGTVLLVGHGGVIMALRYWLEGLTLGDACQSFVSCRNCGITVYERGADGRLHLSEYDTVFY